MYTTRILSTFFNKTLDKIKLETYAYKELRDKKREVKNSTDFELIKKYQEISKTLSVGLGTFMGIDEKVLNYVDEEYSRRGLGSLSKNMYRVYDYDKGVMHYNVDRECINNNFVGDNPKDKMSEEEQDFLFNQNGTSYRIMKRTNFKDIYGRFIHEGDFVVEYSLGNKVVSNPSKGLVKYYSAKNKIEPYVEIEGADGKYYENNLLLSIDSGYIYLILGNFHSKTK